MLLQYVTLTMWFFRFALLCLSERHSPYSVRLAPATNRLYVDFEIGQRFLCRYMANSTESISWSEV